MSPPARKRRPRAEAPFRNHTTAPESTALRELPQQARADLGIVDADLIPARRPRAVTS
jgi:hypothetical protein